MKFKKHLPLLLALLPALTCGLLLLSPLRKTSASSEDKAFTDFTRELFCSQITSNTLTLHYTLSNPAALGIEDAPVTLGLYSPEGEALSSAVLENTREALHSFSRNKLSASNQLTYDILSYQLEQELHMSSFRYYEEIFSPTLGIQAQLPILLAEYTFRCEQDIEDYLDLLEQLDSYYASLLNYQQEKAAAGLFMSDETADTVIAQCREFISDPSSHFLLSTFEERLAQADFLTEEAKSDYLNSNRALVFGHVFPAYELLIDGLSKLKGSGTNDYGLGYYDQGCDYYEAWVSCTTGTGRTMPEIIQLMEEQMTTDLQTITSIVAEHPELLKTTSYTIDSQEPLYILETLEERMQADFPSASSASCQVKYVDPSLEEYLSPAFYLTPPLDRMEEHVIYINPSGNYDSLSLFTTLAHEGYPGHLYQTLYENSCNPDPVRNLFYFGGYVEGWATYAEHCSYAYTNLDSDLAALLSANSFLSLGLHARADVGIHYEGWTPEGLADFLADYGITNQNTIHTMYQAILQDPGNYLKYYLGAAEILQLKKQAEAALEDAFVLKDFHEFLLSAGAAPFPVLEAWLEIWLTNQERAPHRQHPFR